MLFPVSRGGFAARPSSPWVSFASLMSLLSKSMDSSRMNLIIRTYDDFRVWIPISLLCVLRFLIIFITKIQCGFIVETEDQERPIG